MKVRLYHDERVSAKDAPDAWSIYCPYPMKYQRVTGLKGVYLGCKPTDEGMIRCCWDSMEVGQKVSLGKRVALSSTPKAFQVAFRKIERVYQNACKVDTSCKKDEKGVSCHLEVEFDISTAKFHFSKCYAHEVVSCQELSAGGKLKVMAYLIEKAASAYVTEKAAAQKMSLEKLKVLYREDDVVMGEILASEKADGLTIEESFFLYILAQNWANGDEFSWACGGEEEEWVSLVEEARKMKI